MKIQKTVTVNGKELSYDDVKKEFEANGIKATKFVDRERSSLPTKGTFTGYEPAGIDDKATDNDKKFEFAHYRMIATDEKGNEHKISLGRLQAFGVVKAKEDSVLPIGSIQKSAKGRFYIAGSLVNPELPSDQIKLAMSLTGCKFTAEPTKLFHIPFTAKVENQETAKELADVNVYDTYRINVE